MSSSSWVLLWCGLELGLLGFVFLTQKKNKSSPTYFIVQAGTTQGLTITILLGPVSQEVSHSLLRLLILSFLLAKIGLVPFHRWFVKVCALLSWGGNSLLQTVQKVGPFYLISVGTRSQVYFISTIILLNIVVGSLGGFVTRDLRIILAFSSFSHSSLILARSMVRDILWAFYFALYIILTLQTIFLLNRSGLYRLGGVARAFEGSGEMAGLAVVFSSLGGFPPSLGFFSKVIVIQSLVRLQLYSLPIIILIINLVNLYYYTRIFWSVLLKRRVHSPSAGKGARTLPLAKTVLDLNLGGVAVFFLF